MGNHENINAMEEFLKNDIIKNLHLLDKTPHTSIIGGHVILLLGSYLYVSMYKHIITYLLKEKRVKLLKIISNNFIDDEYTPNLDILKIDMLLQDLLGIECKTLLAKFFTKNWEEHLKEINKNYIKNLSEENIPGLMPENSNVHRHLNSSKDPFGKLTKHINDLMGIRAEIAHPHLKFNNNTNDYRVHAFQKFIFVELLLYSLENVLHSEHLNIRCEHATIDKL